MPARCCIHVVGVYLKGPIRPKVRPAPIEPYFAPSRARLRRIARSAKNGRFHHRICAQHWPVAGMPPSKPIGESDGSEKQQESEGQSKGPK